jgi:hypothetical protein
MLSSSRTCPRRHYTTPVANRNLHEEEWLALVDKQVIGTTGDTSILTRSHHTALLRPEASRYSIRCPSLTDPRGYGPHSRGPTLYGGDVIRHGSCRALRGYCRSSSGPAERSFHHGRSSPKFRLPDPCPLACPSHAICLLAMRNEQARRRRLNWPIYLEVVLTSISLYWQEMR